MRLTEKDYCGYDIKNRNDFNGYDNEEDSQKLFSCLQKLGQLEDIEEELGIDLLTLIKAFRNGSCGSVYKFVQNDYNEEYKKGLIKPLIINYLFRKPNTNKYQLSLYDSLTRKNYIVDIKNYGKTWALDKKELTHEELL